MSRALVSNDSSEPLGSIPSSDGSNGWARAPLSEARDDNIAEWIKITDRVSSQVERKPEGERLKHIVDGFAAGVVLQPPLNDGRSIVLNAALDDVLAVIDSEFDAVCIGSGRIGDGGPQHEDRHSDYDAPWDALHR